MAGTANSWRVSFNRISIVDSIRLRKLLAAILGVVGLFAFVAGSVISLIQARYSYLYIQAIIRNSNLDAVLLRIPWWSRIFMVDLAVVAQALVAITGFWVARGAWQAFREPLRHVTRETFPFSRRYQTFYVQLGLWGTVAGFVIGFWKLSGNSLQAPKVLLTALSASLWSTLMAITLAYLLCPLTEFFFQKWLVRLESADGDPMEALGNQAAATATALQRLAVASSAADVNFTLQTVHNQVLSLQKDLSAATGGLQSANQRIATLENALAAAQSAIAELEGTTRAWRINLDVIKDEKAALSSQIGQLQKDFAAAEQGLLAGRQRQKTEIARVIKIGEALMEKLRRSLQK